MARRRIFDFSKLRDGIIETALLFDQCLRDDCQGIPYTTASTTNGGHGRIEERRIGATSEVACFAERAQWKGLKSLAQ